MQSRSVLEIVYGHEDDYDNVNGNERNDEDADDNHTQHTTRTYSSYSEVCTEVRCEPHKTNSNNIMIYLSPDKDQESF